MHTLDMYTRENANKLHLEEMRRGRPYRSLLREINPGRSLASTKWIRLMLIFATILLLLGAS
jgi:hypothetical protein